MFKRLTRQSTADIFPLQSRQFYVLMPPGATTGCDHGRWKEDAAKRHPQVLPSALGKNGGDARITRIACQVVWFHLVSFRQGKVSQDQATVQMLTYQHYGLNHSPAVLFSHLQATTRHSLSSSSSKQKLCWSHHIEFINLSDRSCSKAYLRTMLTVGTSIRRSLQIEGITESTFGCLNMPNLWVFRAKAGLDESLQTPKSLGTTSQIRPWNWNFGAGHPAPASCPMVATVE